MNHGRQSAASAFFQQPARAAPGKCQRQRGFAVLMFGIVQPLIIAEQGVARFGCSAWNFGNTCAHYDTGHCEKQSRS